MMPNEQIAVVGAIDPDVTTVSTVTSGWIDASKFLKYQAIVMAGTLGVGATVDAKLEQATTSGGAGAKDITGKAITQLTEADADSDKQAVMDLRSAELDTVNGFDFFRLSVTVGTATSDLGAIVIGIEPVNGPASDNDASTVDEIVT